MHLPPTIDPPYRSRMDRRRFLLTSLAGVLIVPQTGGAQTTGKVYRVGIVTSTSATSYQNYLEAFRQGLRELQWIEGQNVGFDYRFAEGRFERLPHLAAELVRLGVDIIVASPTPPAVAAKNATGTIPIVMVNAGDPVGVGLVASLARPGGNVTGLAWGVGVDYGKALELLQQAVPNARRVAILTNPANPVQPLVVTDLKIAGQSLGLQLLFLEARGPNDFGRAFTAVGREGAGAMLVIADSLFGLYRRELVTVAAKSRVPTAYGGREQVDAGGLMSYGPSVLTAWRRAAVFVDKILKGAKPADLPVEQPTKFELVINLKTAKALGLTIPPSLLARADQVIE
jgi:putative ABC transport system substrate-binding protein